MTTMTTFDSTKEGLSDLLRSIRKGDIQLPDFQRGWVWDDEHVRSLLASISLSYPIGAVMMLQTGNEDVKFKARPIEGVQLSSPVEADRLILDGQQRLTSLFQALNAERPVLTRDLRGRPIYRWYYLDMEAVLNPNVEREDAVVSLPDTRQVKNFRGEVIEDYSTPEKEYERGLFPISQVFDCSNWQEGHQEYWDYDKDKIKLFSQFNKEIIKRFEQYQVPVISLGKETPKEAVCQVFEKVNTGGVSLTVFELLTATFAAEDYLLRQDWADRKARLTEFRILEYIESTDFLQSVTLVASLQRQKAAITSGTLPEKAPGISCKRRDILRLTLEEYQTWADPITRGFQEAAKLLHGQKMFTARDIPYKTQLVPLAAIFTVLGEKALNHGVRQKLIRWYWCGVFGELYGSAIESRFAKDLPEVLAWVDGGPEPDTVAAANFIPGRLLGLKTRNSAAYKGIYALLMQDGAPDFRSGIPINEQVYFDEKIDIHHIFPQDWCRKAGLDSKRYDSVINKTPLSAGTNRRVSNNPPSKYLATLQKSAEISKERMDAILAEHLIPPDALRANDFEHFFSAREAALLDRIGKAMGKTIVREDIGSVDYDLFSSQWHPFLQALSKLEGVTIEAGGDVEANGVVVGTFLAEVAQNDKVLHLVDSQELSAGAIKAALERAGAKVLLVGCNQLEAALASIMIALQEQEKLTASIATPEVSEPDDSDREPPVGFHPKCIERVSQVLGLPLLSKSRTAYVTEDGSTAVVCTISKTHENNGAPSYWFAFHPSQKEFLENFDQGYVALGCGSPEQTILVPFQDLSSLLDDFWTTEKDDRMYWHIRIHKEGQALQLDRKQGMGRLDITHHLLNS
ncbi:hypothetical protein XM38_013020 [Halomicronema hongdechloris C2206]|uniref:GmrSD restriction endonucleases N-terminal domain-containing protein n=2 Tax=Halomicronema hongdechloris TaxID=1209493 RepID=A0A1Z3HJ72_9CYAN|nr:hypothetical protein XM38_013020 [Halomicronema hongdechloris C2206]